MKNANSSDEQKYTKYIDTSPSSGTDTGSKTKSHLNTLAMDRLITQSRVKPRHKAKGIVVHCSDSPQGRGDNAATIDRWHKERGWFCIGYHYVILENGLIEDGRSRTMTGAHAKGYNHYVGICLIGVDSFTDEQYSSLETLIKALDTNNVLGHYEVSSKTCPNFDVPEFLAGLEAKKLTEEMEQTEIFKEYSDKATDQENRNQVQVENLKRWKTRAKQEQVQAKVQPKESITILDRIKQTICTFCR